LDRVPHYWALGVFNVGGTWRNWITQISFSHNYTYAYICIIATLSGKASGPIQFHHQIPTNSGPYLALLFFWQANHGHSIVPVSNVCTSYSLCPRTLLIHFWIVVWIWFKSFSIHQSEWLASRKYVRPRNTKNQVSIANCGPRSILPKLGFELTSSLISANCDCLDKQKSLLTVPRWPLSRFSIMLKTCRMFHRPIAKCPGWHTKSNAKAL